MRQPQSIKNLSVLRFSTRATYGLIAMLVLAHHYGQRAVPASHIAKSEGISPAYLEQILHRLKRKRWIKSSRGPSGGYILSVRPSEIAVADVLRDLDNHKFLTPKKEPLPKAGADSLARQAAYRFWADFNGRVTRFLEEAHLQDLLEEAGGVNQHNSKKKPPAFHI